MNRAVLWGVRCHLLLCLALGGVGCSLELPKKRFGFADTDRAFAVSLDQWRLDGRVSLVSRGESWSAGIEWSRSSDGEIIRVVGPLGQGAFVMRLGEDFVDVDRGDGSVRYHDVSDQFVTEQLGFYVPLRSLRYWVVGVADPGVPYESIGNGFIQDGWMVLFRSMQRTELGMLPYKVDVSNQDVRLRLVIDQWYGND